LKLVLSLKRELWSKSSRRKKTKKIPSDFGGEKTTAFFRKNSPQVLQFLGKYGSGQGQKKCLRNPCPRRKKRRTNLSVRRHSEKVDPRPLGGGKPFAPAP